MPRLVYLIASTIDGFIADPSGADPSGPDGFFVTGQDYIDPLVREYPETIPGPFHQALGIQPGNRRFDAVMMGRNTYELGAGPGSPAPIPGCGSTWSPAP